MIFQFTLFPLLPLETRLKIIRFAANEPSPQNSRIIRAEYADDIEFPLVRCELPEPPVYLVNWEFRLEALRNRLHQERYRGRLINFNTDVFHLNKDLSFMPTKLLFEYLPPKILPHIRHIAFDVSREHFPVVDARHLHEQCPHLERIILVLKTKLNFNESKSTVKYLPYAKSGEKRCEISDDDIKFVFPNLDKVRRQGWNPKVQFMTKLVSGPLESIYRSWKLVVPRHRRLWIDNALYGVSPDLWSRYWNLRLSLKGYTADVM